MTTQKRRGLRTGRRLTVPLLTTALLTTGIFTAPAAQAVKKGRNGQIAYATALGATSQIVRRSGDGGGAVTPLTPAAGYLNPTWSPDTLRIAAQGPAGIVVFGVNGGPIVTLDANAADRNPSWSPDGRYVAFDNGTTIFIVPADQSSGPVALVSGIAPDWSSDGKSIAYIATSTLFTVDVFPGLGSPVPRTPAGAVAVSATQNAVGWSPDRTRIAYLAAGENIAYVTIGNLAQTIIHGTTGARAPDWSPDGKSILYTKSGSGGIFTTPVTNGTVTIVSATGFTPSWQACRSRCPG